MVKQDLLVDNLLLFLYVLVYYLNVYGCRLHIVKIVVHRRH